MCKPCNWVSPRREIDPVYKCSIDLKTREAFRLVPNRKENFQYKNFPFDLTESEA